MPDRAPIWDPEVLTRLEHLHLKAREATLGFRQGSHRSLRIATNVEFADYKEYTPGDNLRDLDWKVYVRSDKLVVRRQQAETELRAFIVLDASGDLGTGRGGRVQRPPLEGSKFGFGVTVAATLAYFLERRGDPVGLTVWGGEGIPFRLIPPRVGIPHLSQVFATLAAVAPAGRANIGEGLVELGRRIGRRTLVIVVSDFMEEPDSWGPSLSALARQRADVRAVHLYDRKELALEYPDAVRFFSPEGGPDVPIDPPALRTAFGEVVDEYLREVRTHMGRHRGHHVLVSTDEALEGVIGRVVGAA